MSEANELKMPPTICRRAKARGRYILPPSESEGALHC